MKIIDFSEEGLLVTVSYLIPGFLINILLINSLFLEKETNSFVIYKFLFFSLINISVYSIIDSFYFFIKEEYFITNTIIVSLLRNIILPTIIGVFLVTFLKQDSAVLNDSFVPKLAHKVLRTLGLDRTSMNLSAWNYLFYNLQKKSKNYLIISLKDGRVIYGLFGTQSFASSGLSNNNDLFLEQTFINNCFEESLNCGVLIKQTEIEYINIIDIIEVSDDVNTNEEQVD